MDKTEETPTRVGSPVVMADWRSEFLKVAEGKTATAIQEYLKDATAEELKDKAGRVTGLKTEHILSTIEVAKLKIEDKPYDMEFVANTAITAYGRLLLCNGVDDLTVSDAGTDDEKEVPSVTKYFNTAFSQNARNAAAARVRSIVEGPDKAVASAAKKLAGVWGCTVKQAAERIAAMAKG